MLLLEFKIKLKLNVLFHFRQPEKRPACNLQD